MYHHKYRIALAIASATFIIKIKYEATEVNLEVFQVWFKQVPFIM